MTQEEFLVRLGVDPTNLDRGTQLALDRQKKAAMDYTSFWDNALKVRDRADADFNAKSLARLAERTAQEKAAAKEWMENRAAQIEIGKGSGGFSWAGGSSGEVEKIGHAASGSSTRVRELQVMVRELSRLNFTRFFGSLSIFLGTFSGTIKKVMADLMGPFGMALAAVGVAAYALYEDIKGFNKELAAETKMGAESIGNAAQAHKDATDAGIKSAADFEAHIKSLAEAHETLAFYAEKAAQAIGSAAAAQEQLLSAQGDRKISSINLAEHMGMMSGSDATSARSAATADTFSKIQNLRMNSLLAQGAKLSGALDYAKDQSGVLRSKADRSQEAVSGVDSNGDVVNQAAYARNVRMREHENLQADIKKRRDHAASMEGDNSSDARNFIQQTIDPLDKAKQQIIAGDLAIAAKEQQLYQQQEAQHKKDIAAQVAAGKSYEDAIKAVDENADTIKKLNEDIAQYSEKYKDAGTADNELLVNLQTKAAQNQSDQITAGQDADRVTPTIEDLAGRSYTNKLNKQYGPGGIYDVSKGDGPFAGAAQGYELSQKQEMWDIVHGNAEFDDKGKLTGGAAYDDKLRATGFHNMLAGAGLETPAMQMKDLIAQGKTIADEITALTNLMHQDGIVIKTPN